MTNITYQKHQQNNIFINIARLTSIILILIGGSILFYILSPLISWQVYFSPVFAQQNLTIPIPKTTIISASNYKNAQTWFPSYQAEKNKTDITEYHLSIPKLDITNAIVSTIDYNLSSHLVHYGDTNLPPQLGNAVIFGHSTLPQLFNPKDYTTIFANAYKLKIDDIIIITIDHVSYTYKIRTIRIVDPSDTSVFSQDIDNSYLTLVTCTPPGTTWKRLIIKGKLEKI